jgi:Flp pilus assembly protein TadD
MKWSRETVYRWLVPGCVTLGLLVVAGAAGWEWRASSRALPEGMAAFQAGDNLKAIRHLTRAQQNCETDILARYYLGASYQNYGWDSEAEQQYLATCQLADEYGTRAWHSLGRIRYHKGDAPGAAAAFEHALALDSKAVVVWFELGQVQQVLGKLEDAERSLAEALRLDPENANCQKALLNVTLARRAKAETAKEATAEPAKSAPPPPPNDEKVGAEKQLDQVTP